MTPKKSQCDIHSEEIKSLRESRHKAVNDISLLKLLYEDVKKITTDIKDNHLSHIQDSMTKIQLDVQKNTDDIGYLKDNMKFIRATAVSAVLALIGTLVSIILQVI